MHWLFSICMLVAVTQAVLAEDGDSDGGGPPPCPPLATKSVRMVCYNPEGDEQNCGQQAEIGTRVKIMWKKNVAKMGKTSDIQCNDEGVWKKAATSRDKGNQEDGERSWRQMFNDKAGINKTAVLNRTLPVNRPNLLQQPAQPTGLKLPIPGMPNIPIPGIPNIPIPNIQIPNIPKIIPGIPLPLLG